MDPLKPHPPHIEDAPTSRADLTELGEESEDSGDPGDWMTLARQAYTFSTSWVDANYRKRWEDSLRMFNNQHPLDSKYNDPNYSKRSKLFRPKVRSVIRKNEAAAAAAFFSNMDVIDTEATNQADPKQVVSAQIMKMILQYRLTNKEHGIPWFHIVLGALQDAQKQGAVVAKYEWDKDPDKPKIALVPIENFRFDPAADWIDPINSSPYIIELMPMYVCDIKQHKGWKQVGDHELLQAINNNSSSTQITRERGAQDPRAGGDRPISEYEIVWVQRHIHRQKGKDWEFYTLGEIRLLSDPKPLKQSVLHGKRNYIWGTVLIETHSAMPSSVVELGKGLQEEANEIVNQRLDNVKFVLNKRWLVARNKNVDIPSLIRNVPGGVTQADNPKEDIVESNWPDVTSSSYAEQDRLNADMDELLGNFSSGSVMQNKQAMESPMRTLGLLNTGASQLTEYLLRTFTETFVEPALRALVCLEQYYETDTVIMNMAADRVQLYQRYGMNQITDDLLRQELTIKVNVGMGATDPQAKLQKFLMGIMAYANIAKQPPAGMNINEVGKEIFGHLGYQDGKRFMSVDDPQKQQLMQQLQAAFQHQQQLEVQVKNREGANKVKLVTDMKKIDTDKDLRIAEMLNQREIEAMKVKKEATFKKADLAIAHIKDDREGQKQQMAADSERKKSDEQSKEKHLEHQAKDLKEKVAELQKEIKELKTEKSEKSKGSKFKVGRGKDGKIESLELLH